jgi:hypothetical protein
MRGTGIGGPGSATLGDVTPAPGSSGATGSRVSGLLLPGSLGSLPPLID